MDIAVVALRGIVVLIFSFKFSFYALTYGYSLAGELDELAKSSNSRMTVIEGGVGREVSRAQLSYDWYRLDGTLNSG